jgi:WD40 repeat protein
VLLASGGTDSAIRLYCRAAGRPGFELVTRLAGHENWVRGLAFTRVREAGGGVSLLLASASQDRYLRVWLVQQQGREAQERRDQHAAQDQGAGGAEALAQLISRYAPKPSFQAGSCR